LAHRFRGIHEFEETDSLCFLLELIIFRFKARIIGLNVVILNFFYKLGLLLVALLLLLADLLDELVLIKKSLPIFIPFKRFGHFQIFEDILEVLSLCLRLHISGRSNIAIILIGSLVSCVLNICNILILSKISALIFQNEVVDALILWAILKLRVRFRGNHLSGGIWWLFLLMIRHIK
jgi:hypothetical protein